MSISNLQWYEQYEGIKSLDVTPFGWRCAIRYKVLGSDTPTRETSFVAFSTEEAIAGVRANAIQAVSDHYESEIATLPQEFVADVRSSCAALVEELKLSISP